MVAQGNDWNRWFLGTVVIALAGCRSTESMLSSGAAPSTEELAAAIDASFRASESTPRDKETQDPSASSDDLGDVALKSMGNEDGPSIAEQATAAAMEPFAPNGLGPISPARRLTSDDIPPGYQARMDEFERLGARLAAAAKAVDSDFRFDIVYNPKRADMCHTENGHILATSAFLEKVKTRNQLAVALALEMSEHIRQIEQKRRMRELVDGLGNATEFTSGVVVNERAIEPEPITPEQIHRTASELLTRAGFSSVDLAAVHHDIQGLLADQSGSYEVREQRRDTSWSGPEPPAAN